jgi:hypothetical protein
VTRDLVRHVGLLEPSDLVVAEREEGVVAWSSSFRTMSGRGSNGSDTKTVLVTSA